MEKLTPDQLHQAADALDREVKRMQGVTAAARVLRELGTLENRIAEGERMLARVKADVAAAQAELELTVATIESAKQGLAEAQRIAELSVASKASEAQEAAHQIHAHAVTRAEQLVADAQAEAKRVIANGCDARDQAMALAELHRSQAEAVARTIAERRAELDDLEKRLAAAKEQAQRLLAV